MFRVPGSSFKGPLPELTPQQKEISRALSQHVWMLAGDIGARSLTSAPEKLETAALYIEHVFRRYDFQTSRQTFEVETFCPKDRKVTESSISFQPIKHNTSNIIAEIPGNGSSNEIVVVGAHYDSVYDCPAANDNASGVAGLLEIAGALREKQMARTVRFVAFTNEEPPFSRTEDMGSFRYAKQCHDLREKVVAMICLETIGYYSNEPASQRYPHAIFNMVLPTTGNFVSFIANPASKKLLTKSVESFRKSSRFPSEGVALPEQIKGVDFSDHLNFWHFKYPAIMVTDTAFYRYPHYHEQEDTPDKLDYDTLARVVSGLIDVVLTSATL